MAVLNIREFPDDVAQALRVYAAQKNRKAKAVVIDAVREFVGMKSDAAPVPKQSKAPAQKKSKPREVETEEVAVPNPGAVVDALIESSVPDEAHKADGKKGKPTCRHGVERGWRCWQCGGPAKIEKGE